MYAHGVAQAGYLRAPARPDLAFDFLKTEWLSCPTFSGQAICD